MTKFWPILLVSFSLLIAAKPDPIAAQQSLAALADEGQRLASLLRVGRGVISNNQDLINDPTIGDKGPHRRDLVVGVVLRRHLEHQDIAVL